jgi:hypothetical protein
MGPHSFTSLPKEGVLRIIFFALKNPTASAGFEPVNLGSKGQHSTSRPPKPLINGLSELSSLVLLLYLLVLLPQSFLVATIKQLGLITIVTMFNTLAHANPGL